VFCFFYTFLFLMTSLDYCCRYLYKNKHFSVEKKEGSSSINLCFKKPCKEFLQSLAKLDFLFTAPSLEPSFTKIDFLGSSILTMQQFVEKNCSKLSYNTVGRLIWCLTKQQQFLEKAGFAFFSLSFENILVVDDWNFFCANPTLCLPISSKGTIVFHSPFERNKFSSPELMDINKIPSSVSVKTFYYSLASLAFFCFFRKDYDYNYLSNNSEIYSCFQSILGTKLFWFFKRALETDVDKRILLFL